MKKIIFTLIAVIAALAPSTMSAYDIEVDGIYYIIYGNEAIVTFKGQTSYEEESYSGGVIIPASFTYNGKTYSVTAIGGYAFEGCSRLTSVTIPNSVTIIDEFAFFCCSSVSFINIPNSVTSIGEWAFSSTSLTNIEIPNSVTAIAEGTFASCSNLTNVTIPNSVTAIGDKAFSYCTRLNRIEIPNSVTAIGNEVFMDCSRLNSVTIPNSVTSIGQEAFYGCTRLTSIDIPNSVASIGDYAFRECTSLNSIDIPSSVTSISSSAFWDCSSLTSITVESGNPAYDSRDNCNAIIETATNKLISGCMNTIIPNSVTSIGEYAFLNCTGLTNIDIPSSITSVSYSAFNGCTGLTSITVASGNAVYDSRDNCNAIIETATNTLLIGCMNTTIPNSIMSIGEWAFSFLTSLTSINIPNTVTAIGEFAFFDCKDLASITIPNSVISIGKRAFAACDKLKDVYSYIPDPSLLTMGSDVFYGYGITNAGRTLHVPSGSLVAYQADSKWSQFFETIVEMEPITGDVNGDGVVTIKDVTDLIDMLLNDGN